METTIMKSIIKIKKLSILLGVLLTMIMYAPNSNATDNGAVIQIKTGIDGLYNCDNGYMSKDVEMDVYLRNTDPPYEVVDYAKGFIDKKTLTGTFEFTLVTSGRYYIVLKSKNTIETWSKKGGESVVNGTKSVFDFSSGKEKCYGDNLKLEGNYKHACIYTGDVTQDGYVNDYDVDIVYAAALNFTTGDVPEDLNGDGSVTLEDVMICYNNYVKGVKAITPMNDVLTGDFTLKQNKPNPFNPTTQITIDVPRASNVKLSIYDITGREVAQLVNNVLDMGSYTYQWNASDFSSGTYFYSVNINGIVKTMKMNLIK